MKQAGSKWFNISAKKNDYYERPCWVILLSTEARNYMLFMLSCAKYLSHSFVCYFH